MPIEKEVVRGDYKIEIDNWGGCHFHLPEDDLDGQPLSFSPEVMREVEQARREVLEDDD